MFEKLKSILASLPKKDEPNIKTKNEKPVVITIHGYGRRCRHEMDNLALWCASEDYEIVQFDMYDVFDEKDCDWMKWVTRAKNVVNEYELTNRDIYLVGFSMGGVIASYLAATSKHVKKLILLAPAFHYLHVDAITSVIVKGTTSFFTSDKEKEKKFEVEIPKSFYSAFMDVVKSLKKYIEQVSCPVLLLHGDEDEVIPLRSSTWAYDKIPHEQKKLIILHEGHHRLLMDEKVNWECYQVMRLFLDGNILNGKDIVQAPDILDQYQKDLEEKYYQKLAQADILEHEDENNCEDPD